MPHSEPTPSEDLPTDLIQRIEDLRPERLRDVARYVEELADYREREQRWAERNADDTRPDADDTRPDVNDAPSDVDDSPPSVDDTQAENESGKESESPEGDRPEDLPDDVPEKATLTVKEINDNRYYYWQWREGEAIKSKYVAPVNSDG